MATSVIMPALGMAQETGLLVRWLKHEGEQVAKGEPLMEVETDKTTVEIEATASGTLGSLAAKEGDTVPVGQTIAWILAPGEKAPIEMSEPASAASSQPVQVKPPREAEQKPAPTPIEISPVAHRMAAERGIDLGQIKPAGKRIEKADVLAYIQEQTTGSTPAVSRSNGYRLIPASPKARRLTGENRLEVATIEGSGPGGAVLTVDVLEAIEKISQSTPVIPEKPPAAQEESVGTIWRIMAERTIASWTSAPHFYLVREVMANSLVEWRKQLTPDVEKQTGIKLTITDLLVKLIGSSLSHHPRLTASWNEGNISRSKEVNIGLAVAVKDGLVVPVVKHADKLSLSEITQSRSDLVERAKANKLHPEDVEGGTFTLSNLGMYNVDAFMAVINSPQAAILSVGRISDRVVAVDGQAVVRPTIILTLSCDHRTVDGARGAEFLDDLANLIENPWRLII